MAEIRMQNRHIPYPRVLQVRLAHVLALIALASVLPRSTAQLYINLDGFQGARQSSPWECLCPECPSNSGDAPSNTNDLPTDPSESPANSLPNGEHPPLNTYTAPAMGPPELTADIDENARQRNNSLLCECNFRPIEVLYLLADKARGMKRSPKGFQNDLNTLVSTSGASEADDMNKPVSPSRPRGNQGSAEDQPGQNADDRNAPAQSNPSSAPVDPAEKERQRQLARAYNVTPHCNGPNSVTPTRLKMMFPDKADMGQRKDPSSKPSMVQVKTEPVRPAQPRTTTTPAPQKPLAIPALVTKPEFGGLIPQTGLPAETQKKIIAVHLATMPHDRRVPFPVVCIILKFRMEKSLVPDSKKAKFLKYNDVIDNNGQLKGDLQTLHDHVIDGAFLQMIPWQIFGLW